MRRSAAAVDRQFDRRIRGRLRNAVVVGSSGLMVVAILVGLFATSGEDSAAGPWQDPAAYLFIAVALCIVVPIDLGWRFPRPRPTMRGRAVCLRDPRFVGALLVLLASLLVIACLLLIATSEGLRPKYTAAFVTGGGFALVGGIGALMMLVRPRAILLDPLHITLCSAWGKQVTVVWSDIHSIGPEHNATKEALVNLRLVVSVGQEQHHVPTRSLRPTVWVLVAWLNHYLAHPEDRHELATQAGIDRLDAIQEAHMAVPNRPWPRWFPPPLPNAAPPIAGEVEQSE